MTRRESPVSFRPGPLASALDARTGVDTNRNETAQRDLARDYDLLDRSLATLDFTANEAVLVVDALWSTHFDAGTIAALPYGVADAGAPDDLTARLERTSYLQRLAIVDAIERLRAHPERSIADAGLITTEVG